MNSEEYPEVWDVTKVGTFPALAKAGGGYVWDEVLEYRIWCHPENGAEDLEDGHSYYYAFPTYRHAIDFKSQTVGSNDPIALILQREYINEPEAGRFLHVKEERIVEWPVIFLSRPRRTETTILDFLSADPSSNRLDVLRGLA